MRKNVTNGPVILVTFFFKLSRNIVELRGETLCCAYHRVRDQLVSRAANEVFQICGILVIWWLVVCKQRLQLLNSVFCRKRSENLPLPVRAFCSVKTRKGLENKERGVFAQLVIEQEVVDVMAHKEFFRMTQKKFWPIFLSIGESNPSDPKEEATIAYQCCAGVNTAGWRPSCNATVFGNGRNISFPRVLIFNFTPNYSSIVWETTRALCKVLGSLLKSSHSFYNSIEINILDIQFNFLYRYTLQNIYWVPNTEREWDAVQTNSRQDGIFRMVSEL